MLIRSIIFSTFVSLMAIIMSCAHTEKGLLLWSLHDNDIASGSIVTIISKSELKKTYTISFLNEAEERQTAEVEDWRIEIVSNNSDLEQKAKEYAPFAPYFGISERQALPIRDVMGTDPSTSIIYRLAKGEKVKILSQTQERVRLSTLQDYWFEVLTSSGARGFVFGRYLDKIDQDGHSTEEKDQVDETLVSILTHIWRPEYFQWMIDMGRYDLSLFRDEYRFYHDIESARFIFVTRNHTLNFEYEEIFRASYGEYLAIGSDMYISVHNEDSISIQYVVDGKAKSQRLIKLDDDDIKRIIADETTRRQGLLDDFITKGNEFESSRYGNIRFNDNGEGYWSNYTTGNLTIFPEWFNGFFQIDFPLYMTPQLQDSYQGTISFSQSQSSTEESIHFLYKHNANRLQLEFIPDQNIDGNLVERQVHRPVIMFFFSKE